MLRRANHLQFTTGNLKFTVRVPVRIRILLLASAGTSAPDRRAFVTLPAGKLVGEDSTSNSIDLTDYRVVDEFVLTSVSVPPDNSGDLSNRTWRSITIKYLPVLSKWRSSSIPP